MKLLHFADIHIGMENYAKLDPETGLDYSYKILKPLSFELCADFKTSSKNLRPFNSRGGPAMYPYYDSYSQNWEHEAGEKCFERTIDPELYKPDGALKAPLPAD